MVVALFESQQAKALQQFDRVGKSIYRILKNRRKQGQPPKLQTVCCILWFKRLRSNRSSTSSLVYKHICSCEQIIYGIIKMGSTPIVCTKNAKTAPGLSENSLIRHPSGNGGQKKLARWTLVYAEMHGVLSGTLLLARQTEFKAQKCLVRSRKRQRLIRWQLCCQTRLG